MIRTRLAAFLLSLSLPVYSLAAQASITLEPVKDNTLHESSTGHLSNAKGFFLFTGRTNVMGGFKLRRAVLAFNVASKIPKGAKIVQVTLSMLMDKTVLFPPTVQHGLHRLTSDWGEGTSKATLNEGQGATSTTGDATWIHTFFNTKKWTSAGGDFIASASATTSVATAAAYTWSSTTALVSDVQQWLDKPATNFGWVIRGDTSGGGSGKRWASRENLTATSRPKLTIKYTLQSSVVSTGQGCKNGNGPRLTHSIGGAPTIGNALFALNVSNGTPVTIAVVFIGAGLFPAPPKLNNNNCFLYLDLFKLAFNFGLVVGNNGTGTIPLPLPNAASLVGIKFDSQYFTIEKDQSIRSSNALTILIGT